MPRRLSSLRNGADFSGGARAQQNFGGAFFQGPAVAFEDLEFGGAQDRAVVADHFAQFVKEVFRVTRIF
jgi:hypothetical protein